MAIHDFTAPSLEELAALLPAYDFEMLIAKGGMGALYRAKQRSLARAVAIKILPREIGRNPQFRQSFETEARAMARLNHPNLIAVYDSGAVDDMLYIVMEYVPGKSLYHSAYGKKVDPKQAVELIQGICSGLGHAHENGIIHRDIKPANVLLTPKAEPKIGDFGLARALEAEGAGLAMGTPGYIAPELSANPHAADRRSDLYAVGVILYELLAGQRQTADSPPPSTLCDCGTEMDDIWRRATHRDPKQRFQDAAAFKVALDHWLDGHKGAKPRGKKPSLITTPPPATTTSTTSAAADRPAGTAPEPVAGTIQQVEFEVKTNWHFIRNLFIIAALIIAVAIAWKKLETSRAIREADDIRQRALQVDKEAKQKLEVQQQEQEAKQRREEALRQAKNKPVTPVPDSQPVTPPAPKDPPKPETPLESLQRLRLDLANGKRDEMPIGAIRRGDSDFMIVPTPMTWAEAAWFAERCGAHLATPDASEDITWLGQLAPGDEHLWLGAGRSGRDDWTMLDGKRWGITPAPKGLGMFLGISRFGMKTFDAKTLRPSIIQWRRDGSNPASLAAALQAARESLGDADPIYPPGTVLVDGRHYVYVARPISWRDAVDLAERAGGHLAVVSKPAEATAIAAFTDSQVAPDGIWLGGFLKDGNWVWLTGEPWTQTPSVKTSLPTKGSLALLARPGGGWEALDFSMRASGFVIEWSSDRGHAAAPIASTASMNTSSGSTLTAKAKELVLAADRKRVDQFIANAKGFTWDLDVWMRGLSTNTQATWQLPVAKLKALVRNSRVPEAVPEDSGISLSPEMVKISSRAALKQQQINTAFLSEIDRVRTAYQTKLRAEVIAAEASGKAALGTTLRQEFNTAADSASWLKSFGIDPTPGNIPPKAETEEP